MSDERSDADEVLDELEPQPAHEVIPVSRRQTLRALASVGALTTVGSASGQSAGTVVADEAYFSNYGWEPDGSGGGTLTIDGDEYTFDGSGEFGLDDGGVGTEVVTPSGQASELIGPSGQVLWQRDAIPDSVVENFEAYLYEDQSLTLSDRYAGDLSVFDRSQSAALEGDLGLEHTGSDPRYLLTTDYDFSLDTTYNALVRGGPTADPAVLVGNTQTSDLSCYAFLANVEDDLLIIIRFDSGSVTELSKIDATIPNDETLTYEFSVSSNADLQFSVFDSTGSLIDSTSGSDGSSPTYSGPGIGWRGSGDNERYDGFVESQ